MNSNLSYSPETHNLGQIQRFLEPCDLVIWRMTLKNNRAPLLSNIKLYASFYHHMWIQTGVTVQKRLSFVTSVTLTFDLWPWPFAWTLLWSLVITRAGVKYVLSNTNTNTNKKFSGVSNTNTNTNTPAKIWSNTNTNTNTAHQIQIQIQIHNEAETKLPPFYRWHIQIHCIVRRLFYLFKFHWKLFPKVKSTISLHWFT